MSVENRRLLLLGGSSALVIGMHKALSPKSVSAQTPEQGTISPPETKVPSAKVAAAVGGLVALESIPLLLSYTGLFVL